MADQLKRLSIRTYFTLGSYEKDREFRELLGDIARQGMFFIGLLGAFAVIIYTSSYIFLLGKEIIWHYPVRDWNKEIMLLDKGLILILCLTTILLSRTTISVSGSRTLIFVFVWFISFLILFDDSASRDATSSQAYIIFALMMVVVGIPYPGWQMALLNLFIIITGIVTVHVVPALFNMPTAPLLLSQVIYLTLVAIVLTGMSSLIYLSRYEQYTARRHAEELKAQLEERAHTLEILKAKSDQQAEKILQHEQLKDRFFANISHEFRTPLTLILGPLKDFLSGKSKDRKVTVRVDLLHLMQRNGIRLLQLINQLLDLSKIDAGEIQLDLQDKDLNTLVSDTVLSFEPMAEAKHIKLSCIQSDKRLAARIDPQRMEQAISNLVSNAIKFTPEGGAVDVSVTQLESDGYPIQIKVADTGVGISEAELPYIFDRFYQSTQNSSSLNPGTGIGLALVKEIVELHGGSVSVKSNPGTGSEFVLEMNGDSRALPNDILPEVNEDNALKSENPAIEEETLLEDENDEMPSEDAPWILIVDDNPDILVYLKGYLAGRYNVITLEDSSQVVETMKSRKIDLLISDVMMPDPDGFKLCQIIKQDETLNHIPVILLTARAGEESKLEGLELGADDYISKPFSVSELMVRIENLIELRNMLREKFIQKVRIEGKKAEITSADARFLKQVKKVIDEHMEDSNFGVDWLADEVYMSPRHLQRKIRSVTNLSAAGYIRFLRLERASQLIQQNWGNISEVSFKVGFQDTKYFSRLFKQTFGVTPSDFSGQIQ